MRMRVLVNKNGKNMTFNLQGTTVADGFKSVCIFIPFRNRLSNWLHIPYIHSIHTIYIYMYVYLWIYIYYTYKSFYCTTHTHVYKYARIEQTIDLHLSAPHQTKHSRCKREVHLHVTCMNFYGQPGISTMVDQTCPRRIYGWNNFWMPKDLGVFSWTNRCSVDQQNRGHKQRCFF